MVYEINKNALIKAISIEKIFRSGSEGVKVLNGIEFELSSNQIILIMGPSGSDKTTFLNILYGILSPSVGRVEIDGEILEDFNSKKLEELWRNKVSYVLQIPNFINYLTVKENLEFLILDETKTSQSDKINNVLSELDLSNQLTSYPEELSGGELQRLSIATSLMRSPKILLLDEPTANLDPKTACKVIELLVKIQNSRSISMIISSHDTQFKEIATEIYNLSNGILVKEIF